MKVKQLIALLNEMPSDSDVVLYTEQEGILSDDRSNGVFEIETIHKSSALKCRSNDGLAGLKFDSSLPGATDHTVISFGSA